MNRAPSQAEVCEKYGSAFAPPGEDEKLGIALATLELRPLNALRVRPENGTCGWYIWGGEVFSEDANFFQPLHVHHIISHAEQIVPYLALAPGWRVLLAPGHTDVWQDRALLSS